MRKHTFQGLIVAALGAISGYVLLPAKPSKVTEPASGSAQRAPGPASAAPAAAFRGALPAAAVAAIPVVATRGAVQPPPPAIPPPPSYRSTNEQLASTFGPKAEYVRSARAYTMALQRFHQDAAIALDRCAARTGASGTPRHARVTFRRMPGPSATTSGSLFVAEAVELLPNGAPSGLDDVDPECAQRIRGVFFTVPASHANAKMDELHQDLDLPFPVLSGGKPH